MHRALDIRPEVAAALQAGGAVVALETTVLSHGLPAPANLQAAQRMAEAVRARGALPAFIGLLDGRVRVGLSAEELRSFAATDGVVKTSTRDLAAVLATGGRGATTVAATARCAAAAGIRVLATGGIGGVHRGGQDSLDISADLVELSRSPLAVVCAGAKSVLDLGRTLQLLETLGVPVWGWRVEHFPAFFSRDSGLRLDRRFDSIGDLAAALRLHWSLGLAGALVAQPPPPELALPLGEVETALEAATAEAVRLGVAGPALTPFLLRELATSTGGRTLAVNLTLLEANAALGAELARALVEAPEGRAP